LLAGFEILGISKAHVCAIKFPYEDVLEVCPRVDAICREMLKPCSGASCEVEWQVLDDAEIIIHRACSTGKAKVFQPYSRVVAPEVLDDVRRRMKTCQERRLLDPLRERLRAASVRAHTASNISHPRMSAMVVRVTVTVVW
jgi:hypothetical protein